MYTPWATPAAQRNVLRDFKGRIREFVSEDGAQGRMPDGWNRPETGFHVVSTPLVVSLFRDERADDREGADFLGQTGIVRADLKAADFRRNGTGRPANLRAGMRIPSLQLTRPAGQPKDD